MITVEYMLKWICPRLQSRGSQSLDLQHDALRPTGAAKPRVLLHHALRNALVPVITVVGLQTGALVGGAVVTESVFAMPGLGRMMVDGIFERDFPAVQGGILVVVAMVLVVNLLPDLTYAAIDRRIKL